MFRRLQTNALQKVGVITITHAEIIHGEYKYSIDAGDYVFRPDSESDTRFLKLKCQIDLSIESQLDFLFITAKQNANEFTINGDYQHIPVNKRSFFFEITNDCPLNELRIVGYATDRDRSLKVGRPSLKRLIAQSSLIVESLPSYKNAFPSACLII